MKTLPLILLLVVLCGCSAPLHKRYLIVDTHIDTPIRLYDKDENIGKLSQGEFDYIQAQQGGLDLAFMSIYTPSSLENTGKSKRLADKLIDRVELAIKRHPDKFMKVTTPEQAYLAFSRGKVGLAMGMENASPLEHKLENLQHFAARGVSYITLAHAHANHLSDSSYDSARPWQGLSPFGREVVAESNRLGVMLDVSHLSDKAAAQVIALSQSPVIASHSSLRALTPGFERNINDELLRQLAAKGGVLMINFGSGFLTPEAIAWNEKWNQHKQQLTQNTPGLSWSQIKQAQRVYRQSNPYPFAQIKDVVAHINYGVKLVGIDHIGFGSDFDGVGDTLPVGLKNAADYPELTRALEKEGYTEQELEKLMGKNLLRVWQQVNKGVKPDR